MRRFAKSCAQMAFATLSIGRVAHPTQASEQLARLVMRSLYAELVLYPKPGLVSMVDNGSHQDMNAQTFMRSLFALRHYFRCIALAGAAGAPFAQLRQLGLAAETAMLRATQGINTHRGAIFSLGLLCAAAARCQALGLRMSAAQIRAQLLAEWGQDLQQHQSLPASHGAQVAHALALGGAREQAADGFPTVFAIALPHWQALQAQGRQGQALQVEVFFVLLAHLQDTNVLYRGGLAGAQLVQQQAQQFLAAGGTATEDWSARAIACHQRVVKANLSPGGAADLFAATYFIQSLLEQR